MGDLVLKGATSGQITLTPTAVAGTNTLTLPAATGTVAYASSTNGAITATNILQGTTSVTGAVGLTSTAFGVLHQCTGTSADYTITLPAVSGNAGKIIGFQMSTALTKLVTIDGNGSETIDGSLTRIMWAGETATLYCDGTAWTKIAGKTIPMIGSLTVNATQSVATATDTKKTLGATQSVDNGVPSMSDTANSKITAKRPGKYTLFGSTRISNISVAANMETRVYYNGSELTIASRVNSSGDWPACAVSIGYTLAVGDYIELYAKQYTGVNQTYGNVAENILTVTELPQW